MKLSFLIYWTFLSFVFSLAGLTLYLNSDKLYYLLPVVSLACNTFYWIYLDAKGFVIRPEEGVLLIKVGEDEQFEFYKNTDDGSITYFDKQQLVWGE